MVRAPLVWAGLADPCLGLERLRREDPVESELAAVLSGWREQIGVEVSSTAQELLKAARDRFQDALLEVSGKDGRADSRRLGVWLKNNRGRIVGRIRIERAGEYQGRARWRIVETPSVGVDGVVGVLPTPEKSESGNNNGLGAEPPQPHQPHQPLQRTGDDWGEV